MTGSSGCSGKSKYGRNDDPMLLVNQHSETVRSRSSSVHHVPGPDHASSFSTTQAARPMGESVSAAASTSGRVAWTRA